jgi:hypothetical protein
MNFSFQFPRHRLLHIAPAGRTNHGDDRDILKTLSTADLCTNEDSVFFSHERLLIKLKDIPRHHNMRTQLTLGRQWSDQRGCRW